MLCLNSEGHEEQSYWNNGKPPRARNSRNRTFQGSPLQPSLCGVIFGTHTWTCTNFVCPRFESLESFLEFVLADLNVLFRKYKIFCSCVVGPCIFYIFAFNSESTSSCFWFFSWASTSALASDIFVDRAWLDANAVANRARASLPLSRALSQ